MTDTNLLPCPFCGSKNLEVHGKPGILNAHDDVGCNDCNAFSPLPTWNRRAQPASVPDEVPLDIEAAAQKLAECMDYPWDYMPEEGRNGMRRHAKAVIDAAMSHTPDS